MSMRHVVVARQADVTASSMPKPLMRDKSCLHLWSVTHLTITPSSAMGPTRLSDVPSSSPDCASRWNVTGSGVNSTSASLPAEQSTQVGALLAASCASRQSNCQVDSTRISTAHRDSRSPYHPRSQIRGVRNATVQRGAHKPLPPIASPKPHFHGMLHALLRWNWRGWFLLKQACRSGTPTAVRLGLTCVL